MADMVNHPAHYTGHPKLIECIDVIEDNPFPNLANAMKYVWRVSWGSKGNDLEDLEKAAWYINRELIRRTVPGVRQFTEAYTTGVQPCAGQDS